MGTLNQERKLLLKVASFSAVLQKQGLLLGKLFNFQALQASPVCTEGNANHDWSNWFGVNLKKKCFDEQCCIRREIYMSNRIIGHYEPWKLLVTLINMTLTLVGVEQLLLLSVVFFFILACKCVSKKLEQSKLPILTTHTQKMHNQSVLLPFKLYCSW